MWNLVQTTGNWLAEKFCEPNGDFWTMVQAILIPASFYLVLRQIKLQRLGTLAVTLDSLEDRWQSESLLKHRSIVCQCFGQGENRINKPEEAVCGFFETFGVYARERILPVPVIWDSFSFYAENYWAMLSDHIKSYRAEVGDPTFFTEFEWLVSKLEKHGRKRRLGKLKAWLPSKWVPNPELKLHGFIQGETQDTTELLSRYQAITSPKSANAGTPATGAKTNAIEAP